MDIRGSLLVLGRTAIVGSVSPREVAAPLGTLVVVGMEVVTELTCLPRIPDAEADKEGAELKVEVELAFEAARELEAMVSVVLDEGVIFWSVVGTATGQNDQTRLPSSQ
jgi:hypothetical protein